ncbi:MAG: TauD/TfdA family dioxygenase [Burkholderiales bacterium]|jgi:taurine dioxygenase
MSQTAAERVAEPPATTAVPSLSIRRAAGRIGAEVLGLAISPEWSDATFGAVRDALHRHKVLFFRGQHHLDDAAQEAFARRWGPIVEHPTVPSREGTRLLELDSRHGGRADSWHTDVTFEAAFPVVSILRAVLIPPVGGDTVWANTAAAYAGLPVPLRALADALWARHGNDYDYAATRAVQDDDSGGRRYRQVFTSRIVEAEHPVVQLHPETGERALILGHFVKRLVGYGGQDSAHLVSLLQSHVTRLENTVRWQWAQGDVALWDNRATQHYAINDYGDAHRVVRRVTVAGEAGTGVDGRRSRSLAG